MVKVYEELDCSDIENKSWGIDDDFWKVIHEQNLETALENYLEETAPEEGYDLTDLNDILRFDGEEVLNSLGADLTGTIWDDSDDSDDEEDDEDEEDEEEE